MYGNEPNATGAFGLSEAYALLQAISRAQEHVIREDAPATLFEDLLRDLRALTASEYGNIGEVLLDEQGRPYLKTHACCDVAWNEATRRLFAESQQNGMEFRRLDSLYGAVMTSGQVVIANAPASDPRRCGLPDGHPPLHSYIGIPVYHAGVLVAMIGLANRPGGYDQLLVEYLHPLIATYGRVIGHYRLERQKRTIAQSLEESQRYAQLLAQYLQIISGLSQQAVAEATLAFLYRELGDLRYAIVLLDEEARGFYVYAVNGSMPAVAPAGSYQPMETTLLVEMIAAQQPRYLPDLAREAAGYAHEQALVAAGMRSAYLVPLWAEDRFLGVLKLGSGKLDGFTAELRRFVPLLAPSLAHAMHSARLFDALQRSERALSRFRGALDNTVDNVLLIDPATAKFVDCNRSALARMGYTREELLTLGPVEIMPQLPVETVRRMVEQVLSGAQEYVEYSTVHLCKDGSLFPVEVRLSKFSGEGEQPLLIAMARDVSERALVEEKYRLLAAVVESTAEGVVISDTDNRIVAVNTAFTAITGYEEAEVLGKNPKLLRSGRHTPEYYAELRRSLQEDGVWQGELWDRRKNGEVFPTWSTISAVYDQHQRLTNYVSVFSDISALKQSQQQLDFLAHHDPLTQLPNRLLLNDRLDHALHRAHRDGHQVAVLFLDLDRFKNVNDSLGHPVGDQLLVEAANRIKQIIREDDTVARLGGDEFIIVMEDIQEVQHVAVLAQKLMTAFAKPFHVKGHELHLTLSMGVSLYPRDGQDSATLIRNADAAMYRAKEEGRNDYQFYTASLTAAAFERLTMESALRQALGAGQLVVHYQPQYHLPSGRLCGAEALVRWLHPQLGLVMPDKFIPLAEDTGLIVRLGDWVLAEACRQARSWQAHGLKRISVNVSGIQFQRGDIVSSVVQALEESGLEARHLELEITESFIMQKADWAISMLDTLKAIGVTIAIDDFGTGYSSLSYLKRLPVDKLKIDRSFVRDIPQDANDAAITEAVLALGRSLQLDVVAEGVETVEQQEFLRALNCHEVQGYLYSRPLPVEAFESLLARGGRSTVSSS
ncbi:MAG: EAL domain-containing protein [Pseudomonadota bacterium]